MNTASSLQPKHTQLRQITAITLALGLLAACNAPQTMTDPGEASTPTVNLAAISATRYDYAITVKANSNTTAADLERKYVGKVIAIHGDAGFAIMGLTQNARDKLLASDTNILGIETNKNTIKAPTVVGSAGWSAWSGGWSAWSGGWSAWSGGTGSSTGPNENTAIWNHINLPGAHTLAPQLGKGVTVAIVDTGVDLAHPAFKTRLSASRTWWDFVGNDSSPQEEGVLGTDASYGHGTSVAGIVAQVAPNATLLPLRALAPDGSGDLTSVIAAIEWAVSSNAKVINLSLGATTPSKALASQIAWAGQRNVIIVSSSGNTGDTNITYPARYAEDNGSGGLALGVGSVSTIFRNVKSLFSTFEGNSTGIELMAPGEFVYGPYPGGLLAFWSGTSMAAPMVSGSLALGLGTTQGAALPKTALLDDLLQSTTNINSVNPSYVGKLGSGALNAAGFIQAVLQ